MNFTEMVTEVAGRLNLTSTDAITRIGQRINQRYKAVTSAIGLETSRITVADVDLTVTDTGVNVINNSDLPEVTVTNMEKVLRVSMEVTSGGIRTLNELTYDELTRRPTKDADPRAYAIKNMYSGYVIMVLDGFSSTDPFTIQVEGYTITPTLSGSVEPFIPGDFHDILIEGAMSDELRKMEKPQLATIAESNYVTRLSDLRMFIAKNSYLDIYQGKDRPEQFWLRPWYSRYTF